MLLDELIDRLQVLREQVGEPVRVLVQPPLLETDAPPGDIDLVLGRLVMVEGEEEFLSDGWLDVIGHNEVRHLPHYQQVIEAWETFPRAVMLVTD
jgi:hypothetical protein